MKATITIDYTIDGEITDRALLDGFLSLIQGSVVCSEDVDGTEEWAILLNSIEVDINQ